MSDPTAAYFAALPANPSPCPACHCPQFWFSRYSITNPTPAAWKCEACSPPAVAALALLRVLVVDVGAESPFASNCDTLGIPIAARQWHRLQVHHERDTRDPRSKPRRVVTVTPTRCEANRNRLDDDGEGGEAGKKRGDAKTPTETGEIFFDDRLGKVFWYAEMNGAMGRDAKPTGRIIYRDLDDWWREGEAAGDWASVEREVANYEKFVKPKLGKKVG